MNVHAANEKEQRSSILRLKSRSFQILVASLHLQITSRLSSLTVPVYLVLPFVPPGDPGYKILSFKWQESYHGFSSRQLP
jgi:hypothetical protein